MDILIETLIIVFRDPFLPIGRMPTRRLPLNRLPIRRRIYGLNTSKMQEISKIRKQIIQLIPIVNNGLLPMHVQTHMHALFLLFLERYYQLSYVHIPIERRIFTPRRSIDSFLFGLIAPSSSEEWWLDFSWLTSLSTLIFRRRSLINTAISLSLSRTICRSWERVWKRL